jgi:ketosteroid isomerase-like protein
MSQELVDKVVRSLDAWNRRDAEGWLESAHPEIEWISEVAQRMSGDQTVYRGVADMRRFWDEWHGVWDVTIDLTEVLDRGDTVIALANLRTHGEASGIALERPVAYVFEFEGGLVRRARAYLDPQKALDAAAEPGRGAAPG